MDYDLYMEDIKKVKYGFTREDGSAAITLDNNFVCWPNMYQKHSHHMLELSTFIKGHGVYEIGNKAYDINPFDVYIISNTEPHRIMLTEGQSVQNLVLHFETTFLWNFYGQMDEVPFLDVFFNRGKNFSHRLDRSNPATRRIYNLFIEMLKVFSEQPRYYKLQVKLLLETILCEILCNYDYCDTDVSEENRRILSHKDLYNIDEVMGYINFNIDKHLTLQELSQIACVSPAYFSSIFKHYNGITLFEYITQKRVDYAVQLIKTTSKSLTEIAILCGFNSSTSFNKAFGRITGCAPSFFRKKCKV